MDNDLSKLYLKIVDNHQKLVSAKKLMSSKSERYKELRNEILFDTALDTLIDLSAYVIVVSRMSIGSTHDG